MNDQPEQMTEAHKLLVNLASGYAETLANEYDPIRTVELSTAMMKAIEATIVGQDRPKTSDVLVSTIAILVTQLMRLPAGMAREAAALGISMVMSNMLAEVGEHKAKADPLARSSPETAGDRGPTTGDETCHQ